MTTRVLIVDDNRGYREAFRRNLLLHGYDVLDAEDGLQALEILQREEPDVVVTDLAMRHATEGLDLIRQVRALRPRLPVIMISAVGTFDEGAEAMRLGAARVLGKARIDAEIDRLYEAIDEAARRRVELEEARRNLAALAALPDRVAAMRGIEELLGRPDTPDAIKGEAFDLLAAIRADSDVGASGATAPGSRADNADAGADADTLARLDAALEEALSGFASLDSETRQNLRTAEFLFRRSSGMGDVDFDRSMGFAYCFAVENEAKTRLRKRLQKFLSDPATPGLVSGLLEKNGRNVSIFYQQHILRTLQGTETEATIENFFHTFQRVLEHRARYKPDGLKALGIVLLCFGRSYSFRDIKGTTTIDNPLGLRGFDSPDEVVRLAGLLVNLQHYRNPYIHPEISERIKLSQIRDASLACLRYILRIQ